MKKLLSYGFAAALVLFTALPALARSYDVCLGAGDLVLNGVGGFAAVAPVFPGGTIKSPPTAADIACDFSNSIGTFFASGVLVGGFSAASPTDVAYVNWHFRINGQGAFDTSGPVESTPTYPQTITGSTNIFVAPLFGTAAVTNLAGNAFRISVGF
ncbi:MAG TPA: hypothetical protein VIX59_16775 [Candidatus Binataceae bacterium]